MPREKCQACPRAYVNRPRDTLIIAGVEMRLCSRCAGALAGWVSFLWEFKVGVAKVEQLPFETLGPDLIEKDGTNEVRF